MTHEGTIRRYTVILSPAKDLPVGALASPALRLPFKTATLALFYPAAFPFPSQYSSAHNANTFAARTSSATGIASTSP